MMNNITNTLSDQYVTKIDVVDLEKNILVHDFITLKHLMFENVVRSCHFQIQKLKYRQ